jgi:hypothetical protein
MKARTGGCLCGQVRYQITAEPVISRLCWCRDCQYIAGNGTANAIFPTASISVTGSLSQHNRVATSGNTVTRKFCPNCGCHVLGESSGRAGMTVVRLGTLDEPSSIKPVANIWASSAPAWACLDAELQRVEGQP